MKRALRSALVSLFTAAVLAALLWYGNVSAVLSLVEGFRPVYILWFMLLLLLNELARAILWNRLLEGLGMRVAPRMQMFSFAAGESLKFLPTGAYAQNVVLQRALSLDFGRSAAATTMMVVSEIGVALLAVVGLGIGDWSLWLRATILVVAVLLTFLARALVTGQHEVEAPHWTDRFPPLQKLASEVERLRRGTAALLRPRYLLYNLALTALYEVCAGAGLYVVVRALGIQGVSIWQTVAVNCFGLAFYVVLGSLEAASAGAFMVIGVGKTEAVTAILVNRALSICLTAAFAALVLLLLQPEWRLLRAGSARAQAERGMRTADAAGAPSSGT